MKDMRLKRWKAFRRWAVTVVILFIIPLLFSTSLYSQSQQKAQTQPATSRDEQIDVAMDAFTDFDLLRLRAKPPVKRDAGITPPFKQVPPDAQKDFCPNC